MLPKLVVMISGSGTNLQTILNAIEAKVLKAQVGLVVSNRKNAYGLVRAEQAGIPTLYFPLKPYTTSGLSREQYDVDLAVRVNQFQPDLIVLAGWMHIFSSAFLDTFPNKVINLHPALPGAFAGAAAIERTFEAYQRGEVQRGGCMVHYVVPELDAGPVIGQAVVAIEPNDTLEDYAVRLHAAEHQLIIESVQKVITKSISTT